MKKLKFMITILVLFFFYSYIANLTLLPKDIVLINNEKLNIKLMPFIEKIETVKTSQNNVNNKNIELKLFGKVHLKDVNVNCIEDIEIVPVGKIIGLKLYTNGVLIVGFSEIKDNNNILKKPYNEEEIKEGDTIIKINDEYVENIDDLRKMVADSEGNKLNITLLRDGTIFTSSILPVKDRENEYKLGLWVKDAATGVGTISFYEPKSHGFGALGHGITDSDTDNLIDIDSGELVTSKIISIKKGEKGIPRRNKRNYNKSTINWKCRKKYKIWNIWKFKKFIFFKYKYK